MLPVRRSSRRTSKEQRCIRCTQTSAGQTSVVAPIRSQGIDEYVRGRPPTRCIAPSYEVDDLTRDSVQCCTQRANCVLVASIRVACVCSTAAEDRSVTVVHCFDCRPDNFSITRKQCPLLLLQG